METFSHEDHVTLSTRIKQLFTWLSKGRYKCFSIIVLVVAAMVALRPSASESVIRWTGLMLQLGGVMTVAWGLHTTRKLFGLPAMTTSIGSWLKCFPWRKRRTVLASGFAASGGGTVSGHGYVTHAVPVNSTVDQRLEAIERSISLLHERISDNESMMRKGLSKAAVDLKDEIGARKSEDQTIRKLLMQTSTGGIEISAMGVAWLFFGVILGSGSMEIAQWLD